MIHFSDTIWFYTLSKNNLLKACTVKGTLFINRNAIIDLDLFCNRSDIKYATRK